YTYQLDASNILTVTYLDPLGRAWTHASDAVRDVLRTIDPLGNRTTYGFRNYRLFNATDPLGNLASYAFDGNGFQTASKDALGDRWTFTRDQFGNLLTAVDPLGNVTSYSFGSTPSLRQVVTLMDARGFITSFTYLASGLPQDIEDPLGNFAT